MNNFVQLVCEENKEKFFHVTPNKKIERIQIQIWEDSQYDKEDSLGTCFCSILNSKDNVLYVKQLFNKEYSKIEINEQSLLSDIAKINNLAYQLLLYMNPYFVVLYDSLFETTVGYATECIKSYNKSTNTKHLEINPLCKEIISKVNKIYDDIIETIKVFDDFYSKGGGIDKIYLPPSTIKAVNGKVTNKINTYSYEIHNLDELMGVSFYLLNINKFHVRKCKCSDCNKYFSSSVGQTRYCNNPSPYNNAVPCIKLRGTVQVEGHNQKEWEKELDMIEEDMRSSRQFLYDHIKSSTKKREREMLERNHQFFLDCVKKYKKFIKGATDENKRQKYLDNYKLFIKEIRNNQHSSPPKLKVKVPKF